MRYLYQSILIGLGLLASSCTYAYTVNLYADVLYWQPSESVDWALTNSTTSSTLPTSQELAYKTIAFDYAPGFRIGLGLQTTDWTTRFLYTQYNNKVKASTSGNVISTFMPSKFSSKFYQTATTRFSINFDMLDFDLAKQIPIDSTLVFSPLIGLKGGTINQQINTQYQNPIEIPPNTLNTNNVTEKVSNDFLGLGPTIGLGGQWYFYNKNALTYHLFADFAAAYLFGKWNIDDKLYQDNAGMIGSVNVGARDFGSFTLQGLLGVAMTYKQSSLKLGYEASDWFNQYQVFDNGSGTHTNDLVFQGFTLAFNYRFD